MQKTYHFPQKRFTRGIKAKPLKLSSELKQILDNSMIGVYIVDRTLRTELCILCHPLVFRLRQFTVNLSIRIEVVALPRPHAEIVVFRTIVVRGNQFKNIDFQIDDPIIFIADSIGNDLIEAVNRNILVIRPRCGVETTARPCFRPLALSTAKEAVGSGVEVPRASRNALNTPLLVKVAPDKPSTPSIVPALMIAS